MALYNYRCGHCKYDFKAADFLPCDTEQICPRCGWGVYGWVPSLFDKAIGKHYVYFVTGQVCRAGRERMALKSDGLFKQDINGELDDPSTYIPAF